MKGLLSPEDQAARREDRRRTKYVLGTLIVAFGIVLIVLGMITGCAAVDLGRCAVMQNTASKCN